MKQLTEKDNSVDWDNLDNTPIDLSDYKTVTAETPPAESSEPESEPETPANDAADDLSDPSKYYQSGAKKGQRRPMRGKTTVKMTTPENRTLGGDIIDGALLLMLVDMVLPALICGVNNMFTPVKVNPENMGLTDAQQKKLEPLFNAIVKAIKIEGNPIVLGLVSLLMIYTVNFFALRSAAKLESKNE